MHFGRLNLRQGLHSLLAMKPRNSGLLLTMTLLAMAVPRPNAAAGVAPPNILWHNKFTGQNKFWTMNGTTVVSETPLQNSIDPNWKLIGSGDFNGDGEADIVWQNEITGQNAVWYMKGTNVYAAAFIQQA